MNEWVLLVVAAVPLFVVWVAALVEMSRRGDLGKGRRALWWVFLLLIPVISLAAYVVVRPPRDRRFAPNRSDGAGSAEAIVLLAERHRRGEVTDDEYRSEMTRLADRSG